jgi:hypothetical protein
MISIDRAQSTVPARRRVIGLTRADLSIVHRKLSLLTFTVQQGQNRLKRRMQAAAWHACGALGVTAETSSLLAQLVHC